MWVQQEISVFLNAILIITQVYKECYSLSTNNSKWHQQKAWGTNKTNSSPSRQLEQENEYLEMEFQILNPGSILNPDGICGPCLCKDDAYN